MLRKNPISFLTALLLCIVGIQSANASYPIVRNYPRTLHAGGAQTWDIARDSIGRMLFANGSGLLTYDSDTWGLYGVANGSTIRSLLVKDRRIYAGASEEIGYFVPEEATGRTKYHSLTPMVPAMARPFKEVWNIMAVGNDIVFVADNNIFIYSNNAITNIPVKDKITASALIEGNIYIATLTGKVYTLISNSLTEATHCNATYGCRICAILPFHGKIMLVTEYNGLFVGNGDEFAAYPTDIDEFLCANQVFCATARDNNYVFGTVSKGIAIKNFATGKISYANKATGMQNNTVLCAEIDDDGLLWLGLDNGIDLVSINAPYTDLLGSRADYGAGYMSRKYGDYLYLGTNQGLYVLSEQQLAAPEPPTLHRILKGQVWDINNIDGDVLVCYDAGLGVGSGRDFRHIAGIGGCWAVAALPTAPGYALVSGYDSFHLIQRHHGSWRYLGPVKGFNDRGGRFVVDNNGNIWIANWLNGLYRIRIDAPTQSVIDTRFYDSSSGFASNRNINVVIVGGKPTFSAEGGFYSLSDDGDMVVPDTRLASLFGHPQIPRLYPGTNGALWCLTNDNISVAFPGTTETMAVDSITFAPMAAGLIAGFADFNFISNDRLLVSKQNGFYDVDLHPATLPLHTCGVSFKSLTSYGDSISTCHPWASDAAITLPYGSNSQRFEVIAPEYRADNAVTYSYYLEDYDSGWSDFTTATAKEYTKLPEGRYTMHVRAKNDYTHSIDENTLMFSILPPWYKTTAAKITYTIITLALLYLLYMAIQKLSLRASRHIEERKQQELEVISQKARQESLLKDYEIAELKSRQLEQDILYKTRELSNITMNVVRKNEILQDISNRLDQLKDMDSPAEMARAISHIRATIRENISHDDDLRTFMHNFDAAYGDFTKRLQEQHAGLTPTELRVCCYIIMGLNSKEMANAFNISYRSVEMTRYRLRKKLELDRSTNLTDYLQGIFNAG